MHFGGWCVRPVRSFRHLRRRHTLAVVGRSVASQMGVPRVVAVPGRGLLDLFDVAFIAVALLKFWSSEWLLVVFISTISTRSK